MPRKQRYSATDRLAAACVVVLSEEDHPNAARALLEAFERGRLSRRYKVRYGKALERTQERRDDPWLADAEDHPWLPDAERTQLCHHLDGLVTVIEGLSKLAEETGEELGLVLVGELTLNIASPDLLGHPRLLQSTLRSIVDSKIERLEYLVFLQDRVRDADELLANCEQDSHTDKAAADLVDHLRWGLRLAWSEFLRGRFFIFRCSNCGKRTLQLQGYGRRGKNRFCSDRCNSTYSVKSEKEKSEARSKQRDARRQLAKSTLSPDQKNATRRDAERLLAKLSL